MNGRFGFVTSIISILAAIVVLGAFNGNSEVTEKPNPVELEPIAGTDRYQLTLIPSAAERLDIQTSEVEVSEGGATYVPSAALIITPDGSHWVYTNERPLVFQRHLLTNVVEDDYLAYFDEGPAPGTAVVTTGVPELYGAEFGIGK